MTATTPAAPPTNPATGQPYPPIVLRFVPVSVRQLPAGLVERVEHCALTGIVRRAWEQGGAVLGQRWTVGTLHSGHPGTTEVDDVEGLYRAWYGQHPERLGER